MPRNMIYQYVKDLMAGRLASGFNHCTRIYHLARELDVDNYDDDILYAACYLHDIVIGENSHKLSAEKAEQILHEVGFPANKISAVKEAILTHWPGENPETIEAKLLHDANLLDSLGAIGVVRLSIGAFFWYHYKTLRDVLDLIKDYRNKAKELIFPRARELAEKKIKFMDELIFELEAEEHL
ncbi:MAG TPA: HD domain-containing protein [Spirochaetota bacterium]|nr:HD domain-containing protein [Spirochaetota bacterium]HOL57079.1 HD domain-containing protein [Spirochaetota bacterium]